MADGLSAPAAAAATAASLDDYAAVVGASELAEIRALAQRLAGRSVKMVNSTSVGGGVAEILNRLVPLLNEAGLPCAWDVITGGDDFFEVTKAFHNALHGAPYDAPPQAFDTFLAYNEKNLRAHSFDSEFVVIHDPQPIGLVKARDSRPAHWVWRCHIDVSNPNRAVWDFLAQFIQHYDAMIISSPSFTRPLPVPQYLFFPSIDPLSQKNQALDPAFVQKTLERFSIDPKRPILTQISRFDRLKDPVGVIKAYKLARKYKDCQLVLAGGGAADDPEGGQVLSEAHAAAGKDPDIHILELPPWSALEINALQQASTIIIQKSLREGFGLTVTEALWKKKPVIAGAVGGIPLQIIHKLTGVLAHSVEGTAYQIRFLLSHPEIAKRLGENGREHVRENFLITTNLKRYLLLFLTLSNA
ncbi:MAG: glycosyltransferase [Acidobacteria bacterium]|nr:glycosyltransferase [Acidobacteriota bacterium]MCL5288789.1 glycosyltransferase [Acidobacteriota bacterium]